MISSLFSFYFDDTTVNAEEKRGESILMTKWSEVWVGQVKHLCKERKKCDTKPEWEWGLPAPL